MNTVSSPSPSRQAPPAGDSRLNEWTFKVLTDRSLLPKPGKVGRDTRRAVATALFLRDMIDPRTGYASPSIRAIASATGLSRGSAERAIRALVALGHVRLISGGGGTDNTNIYKLTGGSR
jgi:hypothetical protein